MNSSKTRRYYQISIDSTQTTNMSTKRDKCWWLLRYSCFLFCPVSWAGLVRVANGVYAGVRYYYAMRASCRVPASAMSESDLRFLLWSKLKAMKLPKLAIQMRLKALWIQTMQPGLFQRQLNQPEAETTFPHDVTATPVDAQSHR